MSQTPKDDVTTKEMGVEETIKEQNENIAVLSVAVDDLSEKVAVLPVKTKSLWLFAIASMVSMVVTLILLVVVIHNQGVNADTLHTVKGCVTEGGDCYGRLEIKDATAIEEITTSIRCSQEYYIVETFGRDAPPLSDSCKVYFQTHPNPREQ